MKNGELDAMKVSLVVPLCIWGCLAAGAHHDCTVMQKQLEPVLFLGTVNIYWY